jgi:hypothetical protein
MLRLRCAGDTSPRLLAESMGSGIDSESGRGVSVDVSDDFSGAEFFLVTLLHVAITNLVVDHDLIFPFFLTLVSGLSTTLGALYVVLAKTSIDRSQLAFTCGLAGGVMIFVSFIDMLLPAAFDPAVGVLHTVIAALAGAGALFFCLNILNFDSYATDPPAAESLQATRPLKPLPDTSVPSIRQVSSSSVHVHQITPTCIVLEPAYAQQLSPAMEMPTCENSGDSGPTEVLRA